MKRSHKNRPCVRLNRPCVRLSVSQLFHVGHIVQNRRSALLLARHEWKATNERFTAAGLLCHQSLINKTFYVVFWQTIGPYALGKFLCFLRKKSVFISVMQVRKKQILSSLTKLQRCRRPFGSRTNFCQA